MPVIEPAILGINTGHLQGLLWEMVGPLTGNGLGGRVHRVVHGPDCWMMLPPARFRTQTRRSHGKN
jgi:hypothetical protein